MTAFKQMLEADNRNVFLNMEEFAEEHTILYDGETYEKIPVLLTKVMERDKIIQNAEGLHTVSAVLHVALDDMGGIVPEQKQRISIDDGEALGKAFFMKYKIITSSIAGGMICLELEAVDE